MKVQFIIKTGTINISVENNTYKFFHIPTNSSTYINSYKHIRGLAFENYVPLVLGVLIY